MRCMYCGIALTKFAGARLYRDCLGCEDRGRGVLSGRGSFDRGDLKEVAGATSRAMDPQAIF
jgi:hypothetical protein